MLRQRENSDAFKAGTLSVLVHVLLLGALLISFNWKSTHPVSVAEVELWDSLPAEKVQKPLPPPPVVEPPVVKELPRPAPVVEPKPVLKLEPKPKVDIAIEKKPVEKPIAEKPVKKEPPKPASKPDDKLAKLQEALRQEALKDTAKPSNDALKKLQEESLNEDKTAGEQNNLAAKAGVVDEFKAKIQAKIQGHVNKTLCGDGNPELKFAIALMPTGELSGAPKLVKSSGNAACDDAVERAIMASEPLPLPPDTSLFSQFRNLNLTFHPNS